MQEAMRKVAGCGASGQAKILTRWEGCGTMLYMKRLLLLPPSVACGDNLQSPSAEGLIGGDMQAIVSILAIVVNVADQDHDLL